MVYLHKDFGKLAQKHKVERGTVVGKNWKELVNLHKARYINLCKILYVRHLAQKGRQKRPKKTTFLYKKTLANCKMIMYNIAMDEVEVHSFADSRQYSIFLRRK